MECPSLKNNICLLASKLCDNEPVQIIERTCQQCGGSEEQNKYTVCLAAHYLGQVKKNYQKMLDMWDDNMYNVGLVNARFQQNNDRLKNIINGDGVGSQLWKILEQLGIKHTETCECLTFAEKMNSWGVEGCKIRRKEIIDHMKKNSINYGWGDFTKAIFLSVSTGIAFKINPLDIYGSLLDEAIIRTEKEEKRIPLTDNILKRKDE